MYVCVYGWKNIRYTVKIFLNAELEICVHKLLCKQNFVSAPLTHFEIVALCLHSTASKEKHQERANHIFQRKCNYNAWHDGFLKISRIDSNDLRRMFATCFGLFEIILATIKIADAHLK